MMHQNRAPNHPVGCDVIEAHLDLFIAGLETAGYAANTICTKRAALRWFIGWRRRRKPAAAEVDESEVAEFLESSPPLGRNRRCLASVALLGFLEHLRRHAVITACAPGDATANSALESRYASFPRNEQGLAERSLQVYVPRVPDWLRYLDKRCGAVSVRRLDAGILRAFLLELWALDWRSLPRRCAGLSSSWPARRSASLRSHWRWNGPSNRRVCNVQPGLASCPWFASLRTGGVSSIRGIRFRPADCWPSDTVAVSRTSTATRKSPG